MNNSHECSSHARLFSRNYHPKIFPQTSFKFADGVVAEFALTTGQCSVTALGRGIESDALERHGIKHPDRLLSHTIM